MTQKSVNISMRDREQIISNVSAYLLTAAEAKHPDPGFINRITKEVLQNIFDAYEGKVLSSPIRNLLYYTTKDNFCIRLSRYTFKNDLSMHTLATSFGSHLNPKTLEKTYRLDNLDHNEFTIPYDLAHPNDKDKIVDLTNNESVIQAAITPEIVEQINEYNVKMENVYTQIGAEVKAIINTINDCRTTKQFEASLSSLTNFYPQSVLRKLSAKNEVAEELTEQQKLLKSAMTTIATGKLLASAKKD